MNPRPRGGMKISLVDVRSRISAALGTITFAGTGIGSRARASFGTSAPALAAPTVLSQSRREIEPVILGSPLHFAPRVNSATKDLLYTASAQSSNTTTTP